MIVRILGEGQYSVPEQDCSALESLDAALVEAVDSSDEAAFTSALAALTAEVRRSGTPLPDDAFAPSELVVPFTDATLDETRGLLKEPGASGTEPV